MRVLDPKRLSKDDIAFVKDYFLAETVHLPCDTGFMLGVQCPDIHSPMAKTVAERQLKGYFNRVIASGAPLVKGTLISEAEEMADILRKTSISNDRIVLENDATNTQENVEFARRLVSQGAAGRDVTTVFCFGNAYGGRRILMTMARRWPEVTPALQLIGPRPDFKETWQDHDYERRRLCWEFNKLAPYTAKGWLKEVNINRLNESLQRSYLMRRTLGQKPRRPK